MDELSKLLFTALLAGAGGFLLSYLRKKGENLATHEDINKVLADLRAVTTTTKEIEAKISGDLWDQQKKWELKRDTLFEVTRCIFSLQEGLTALTSFELVRGEDNAERLKRRRQLFADYKTAVFSLNQAVMLVGVVCSEEIEIQLRMLLILVMESVEKMDQEQSYTLMNTEWGSRLADIRKAIRKELGVS